MENIGWASLEIMPSLKGFEGQVTRGTTPALTAAGTSGGEKFGSGFASKASSSIHEKFKETAKFVVAPLVGAFALEKIGELIGDSISLASDLNESQNKVQQVFKSSSGEVFRFANQADRAFGQTIQQARDAASTFGLFGRAAGLNDAKTAKFSISMDKLASDLASFHNTSPEQAIEAIGAAMRGEAEPIRAYGVLLNAASLKAEALHLGLLKPVKDQTKIHSAQITVLNDQKAYNDAVKKSGEHSLEALTAQSKLGTANDALHKAVEGTVPQLTQQQQILAAQSLIMKQTSVAHGDFARTSGGLANQQRILSATWEDAKAKLGRGLLPTVTELVSEINQHVIPAVDDFSTWFGKHGTKAIGDFTDDLAPLVKSSLPVLKTVVTDTLGAVKDAAPAVKSVFDAFNSLPDWAQKAIVVGGAAGVIAKKTGILGAVGVGGRGGGVGGALGGGVLKGGVVPVFVTNEGGIGGVGGKGKGGILGKAESTASGLLAGSGLSAGAATAWATAGAAVGFAAVKGYQASHTNALLDGPFGFNTLVDKIGTGAFHIGPQKDDGSRFDVKGAIAALSPRGSDLDALHANLGKISTDFDVVSNGGKKALGDLTGKGKSYADMLKQLPMRVQTQVLSPGLVKTIGDVETLRRRYDLTPKQVTSVYRLTGLVEARREFDALQTHMGRHTTFEQSLELTGHGAAQRALDGVRRQP